MPTKKLLNTEVEMQQEIHTITMLHQRLGSFGIP